MFEYKTPYSCSIEPVKNEEGKIMIHRLIIFETDPETKFRSIYDIVEVTEDSTVAPFKVFAKYIKKNYDDDVEIIFPADMPKINPRITRVDTKFASITMYLYNKSVHYE